MKNLHRKIEINIPQSKAVLDKICINLVAEVNYASYRNICVIFMIIFIMLTSAISLKTH